MDPLYYIITYCIIVIALILSYKFLGKNTTQDILNKTNLIIQYAGAFVAWAKQFKSDLSGNEKMNLVVTKLIDIADKNNVDIDEEEIRAIAQQAYDNMKNTEKIIEKTYEEK